MQSKNILAIQFPPCGAESHPAFSSAVLQENGTYLIKFPIHIKDLLKGKQAQERWAEDKVRHLRSWGKQATILSVPV